MSKYIYHVNHVHQLFGEDVQTLLRYPILSNVSTSFGETWPFPKGNAPLQLRRSNKSLAVHIHSKSLILGGLPYLMWLEPQLLSTY